MKTSFRYDRDLGAVVVRSDEPLNEDWLLDSVRMSTRLGSEHGCSKYLFDLRQMAKELSTREPLRSQTDLEWEGGARDDLVAVLHPGPTDQVRLFEDVAADAGFTLRVFSSQQDAIDWLETAAQC